VGLYFGIFMGGYSMTDDLEYNGIAVVEVKCDNIEKLVDDIFENGTKYCGKHEFISEYLVFDVVDTPIWFELIDSYVILVPILIKTNMDSIRSQYDLITSQLKEANIFETDVKYEILSVDLSF